MNALDPLRSVPKSRPFASLWVNSKEVLTGSTDQCNTAASFAAGVMKPKVLRGRVFSLSAIASN
jgi:hypothetical protein